LKDDFTYESNDLESMLFAHNYYDWIISLFRNYIGKRVLEVGAGCGNFTEYILREKVEQITSIEPSKNLAPQLDAKFSEHPKVKVSNCFLNGYDRKDDEDFDTIFYINVLEHVEHDTEEIILASQHLKDGGHMLIMVPALPMIYGELDKEFGHFRRYMKTELANKVKQANLNIVKMGFMDIAGILPWWFVYKVMGVKKLSARSVKIYDRLAIPICRFMEQILHVPIGKNLFLIAEREKS
jgi:2-polyprenyl-3-methyl-5-hydroxy-6-metoxy-1,4-benzoquinol methylase